ncbi:MAG TPA: alpha-amylase family glycosyl hydrolase [Kiritimatiellia bacterium]|nr:alpha-amylase family glycosyl hydrolase [Kiritimatiellia bacterium]
MRLKSLLVPVLAAGLLTCAARAEVILQFFNNTWNEIADEIPEIAEAGYTALWLPPPQKASGGLSVGYDLWDPFDLGSVDQRSTVKTRYGTEEDLLRLIETAHRFGLRVYFDNIMNHRAFDIPGYNENTPVDIYPGMLPEDFHLRVTEEGFYRKWDNTVNWGSTWEVQNRNLSDLIDIAHETPNANFGPNEGDTHPKISFVRHPDNPEFYDYHPTLGWVGFGTTNITTNTLAEHEDYYEEDVGGYLMRSIRWLVDKTKVDGLRLDAVKHVPGYFFGEQWDAGKDSSDSGYCGQAQWQFNMSRGFSDWDNHRDTVFDTEKSYGRNDLMIFGEHMGEPPPYSDYWAAGMRLLDARTHSTLNDKLGNPWASLDGLQHPYYIDGFQMGENLGVYYAKSHDDNVAFREELHYALNLTRAGLPDIYTDGNRQAETLGQSGGAFPRHANTKYLGQWGDNRIPNLVYIHNHFARSWQYGRWGDSDVVAYDRIDKRENADMTDGDGCVMTFMANDNYDSGSYREIPTAFPEGAYLWQYSIGGGNYYAQVEDGKIKTTIPPGGYFAFSWRSPEESDLWKFGGGEPLTIYDGDGEEAGWVSYVRSDGPDGDPGFNPYGVDDPVTTDYSYTYYVPRVTSPTNLRFVARVDGSAYNVMMKLDGGIPLNSASHGSGDPRDYPPGNEGSTDVYLGYEQADFLQRTKPEKFASKDTGNNTIGSAGSDSYEATIGVSAAVTNYAGSGVNDYSDTLTPSWVYHNPDDTNNISGQPAQLQFNPAPSAAADSNITIWVKMGYGCDASRMYLYYTTDGETWPEGSGGSGIGETDVIELSYSAADAADGSIDWWTGVIPAMSGGTVLRYKMGAYKQEGYGCDTNDWYVPFPNSTNDIAAKKNMMGEWDIAGFDPSTVVHRPHNDFGLTATGLVDGFHFLQARAFLQRDGAAEGNGKRAAIYNTFPQTFYLDTETPRGEIKYPTAGETLWQNEYGAVVRTDPTVREVWYHIEDGNAANDDGQTGNDYGNGTNALGEAAWMQAYSVTPSLSIDSEYPLEWRFSYHNIPTNGSGVIYVRLLEISSSTNFSLNPVDGHCTELVRTNSTQAPAVTFRFNWPDADGFTLQEGWTIKLDFSTSLGVPGDESRFLIRINDVAQSRDDYRIDWGTGRLEFDMPDLYNGDSNFLHHIAITYEMYGGVVLQAHRYIKFQSTASGPLVQIVDPPEVDSDGQPFKIVLPDVASPSPTQRQYTIQVETDLAARDVWIAFTNSAGEAVKLASVTNDLTGTVSAVTGSTLLTGTGTLFNSQLSVGSTLLLGTNFLNVTQIVSGTNLYLSSPWTEASASGMTAYRVDGNPAVSGNKQIWRFLWTNMTAGYFSFRANVDTNGNNATVEAYASRNVTVLFREMAGSSTNDYDDDDDGIYDSNEAAYTNLPSSNPETWLNGDVHIWMIYGRTDPLLPDTDGDGLPDGLESGWRAPIDPGQTDTNVDTNGDGYPNFLADLDPPFFNTVPDNWDVPNYNFNGLRTEKIAGSMTDPANPDSDYDGIPDGIEDWNRNGWVDGDGDPLYPGQDKSTRGSWPDGQRDSSWAETDPNNSDTDGDDLTDGYGEDKDSNGWIAGDINSNRIWETGELWLETDPLNPDTDGDGLPDGWEVRYGLDPWDCGIVGRTNMQTGAIITNILNGAAGNPDGDTIIVGLSTNEYTNLLEYQNGTNPRQPDTGEPPPEGAVVIGRGEEIGSLTGSGAHYQEFTDWTVEDCLVLDEYEGGGNNNQGGDVFKGWDGFDESRDIIAFYARDGGPLASGGDDKFYFRVDFYDLKPLAEEGNLDLYVVVDTGNPASGEMNLPDDVDTITSNRWEAIVAVYQSGQGRVYVDTAQGNNSTTWGQDLSSFGVEARDQNSADGFIDAYYNSELDAVEFAISRQALLDAGWNGLNPDDLNYQVFTTKDGTCNGCGEGGNPGGGDIGGRSDVRDAIWNDFIAEDYWESQAGLDSILKYWIPGSTRAGQTKVAVVVHGNQAISPGSEIMNLVNDNAGAGYNRPLAVHDLYKAPLNLHITPTLASAIQWASVDTNAGKPWLDGPALNSYIHDLVATNVIYLLGSTFSDHILPYFTKEFNADNVALANDYLSDIYGFTPSSNTVFWTPERVLDADVFDKIRAMGYSYTILDQGTHLWHWLGRTTALGEYGYRINKINDVNCFVINDLPTGYRFTNFDGGLPAALRSLFVRKGLSGTQDQVVTILSNWEDFGDLDDANAYDINLRWMANHPWIRIVALEEIAAGQVDINNDGWGDAWWAEDRGAAATSKVAHNWLHHATRSDYDNWYLGDGLAEGLQNKIFDIRPGAVMPAAYGMMYTAGIVTDTWDQVTAIADPNLAHLARSVLHASVFQTAFHNSSEDDLSRWSTGEYIYPATQSNSLAGFAKMAQAQTRTAAIFAYADDWAASAGSLTTTVVAQADVDLDGENEYVLANKRLLGIFERIGGRMIAAWVRSSSGHVYQVAGNQAGYSASETEEEGISNVETNGTVVAHRTSCFKDWWAGTSDYVNDLYTFTATNNGWVIRSADSNITKMITLAPGTNQFEAQYTVDGSLNGGQLYVRHGLSPNLYNLLLRGQSTLGYEEHGGGIMTLANNGDGVTISARIGYSDTGHTAAFNSSAVDDSPGGGVEFNTVNMRNQVQTHQVEIYGTGAFSFSLGFAAEAGLSAWEQFCADYGYNPEDYTADADGDLIPNWGEFVSNTNPENSNDFFRVENAAPVPGLQLSFDTATGRVYYIWYSNSGLINPAWSNATPAGITGQGGSTNWTDDGSQTAPPPGEVPDRFYKIEVEWPE